MAKLQCFRSYFLRSFLLLSTVQSSQAMQGGYEAPALSTRLFL